MVQTGKIHEFAVVLLGSEYWSGLYSWLLEKPGSRGLIAPADLRLLRITDSVDDAVGFAHECHLRQLARWACNGTNTARPFPGTGWHHKAL